MLSIKDRTVIIISHLKNEKGYLGYTEEIEMINKTELSKKIDKCAEEWGVAGAVAIYKDEECYHKNFYGLADRKKHTNN